MLDIGCGAGFPGLVLKIVFPHIKLTLLDSNNNRVAHLITDENGIVLNTTKRSNTWVIQTPQCFDREILLNLHEKYKNLRIVSTIKRLIFASNSYIIIL